MARRPIIGGNWKMNGTLQSAGHLANDLRRGLGSFHAVDMVVFPPSPFLVPVHQVLRGSSLSVGSQDIHPEDSGAFTSGLSGAMVRSLGAGWTLIGHSERRAWFGDTDARVATKLTAALRAGLHPLLCIGETLAERDAGRTLDVCQRQLDSALGKHGAAALSGLVVAYEPVWAIGTGRTATPEQAQHVHAFIRRHVAQTHGQGFAAALRIQYGGSVKPANAHALLACEDIDGALVGGASLNAQSFRQIVFAASGAHTRTGWRATGGAQ